MHVSTILHEKGNSVYTVEPGQKVSDTLHVLVEKKVGAVVVVDLKKSVCGIISERDIVRAIAVGGASVLDRPVKEFMTADVVTCSLSDSVDGLMSLMTSKRFRLLPVVEDGRLIGIVSIGDVVKLRIAEIEADADALKSYIATG